jgi:hypothetical protein
MATITAIMHPQQIFLIRRSVAATTGPFARYEAVMHLSCSTRGFLPRGKIGERRA